MLRLTQVVSKFENNIRRQIEWSHNLRASQVMTVSNLGMWLSTEI